MKLATLGLLACISTAAATDVSVAITNSAGQPLEDAVVWLVPVGARLPPPPAAHLVIDQQHRHFVPLVSVMQTGTSVDFPNSDNIRHSVYSFSAAKPFTLKLYSGKPSAPVTFDRPGIVLLGCNIHDSMVAWLAVVDSAWYGRSDAAGHLQIRAVPPGQYHLQAWHAGQNVAPAPRLLSLAGAQDSQQLQIDGVGLQSLLPTADNEHHRSGE